MKEKEGRGKCPLKCDKNRLFCDYRQSCSRLDEYLDNPPFATCSDYKNNHDACLTCDKCETWNNAWNWRQSVGWDSQYKHYAITAIDKLEVEKPQQPDYGITYKGRKKYRYTIKRIWDKTSKKYIRIPDKCVKRVPTDAIIAVRKRYKKRWVTDSLMAKVASQLSKDDGITYEQALNVLYYGSKDSKRRYTSKRYSKPCKNPACSSRIPIGKYAIKYGVDARTQYCSDACRKDHKRSK